MPTKTQIMNGIQSTTSRIIANNTVEYVRANGERVVRLHNTDIVTTKPNGDIVLNSGGYKSMTTKARINDAIGPNLYQERSQWFVAASYREDPVPFVDGMILPGGLLPQVTATAKRAERVTNTLLKRIARFVKQIDDLDAMPMPNAGDCMFCSMFDRVTNAGERTNNTAHLSAHITVAENYLHGSLIRNAYVWAGHTEFSYQWDAQRWDASAKQTAKRNLRRYLKAQLGLAG